LKQLIITANARKDLRRIHAHINRENAQAADRFLADLTEKIAWLAATDFTGTSRDHVSKGLRAFPYRERCIYFRSTADSIIIIRVLHQAQDVDRQEFSNRTDETK